MKTNRVAENDCGATSQEFILQRGWFPSQEENLRELNSLALSGDSPKCRAFRFLIDDELDNCLSVIIRFKPKKPYTPLIFPNLLRECRTWFRIC